MIALLKEHRQALISRAVTKGLDPKVKMKDSGIEWIGEVPEHWEVKKFNHVVDVVEDRLTPRLSPTAVCCWWLRITSNQARAA
jgi:type I restriction enzyme S subunit